MSTPTEHQRELARQRNAKYRAAHQERLRVSSKVRRDATREQRRAYNSLYRAQHRDEARTYRDSLDPTRVRAYMKAYNDAHHKQILARKKAWNTAHRDERLVRAKAYYASHKDEYLAYVELNRESVANRQASYKRANRSRYTALQINREAAKLKAMPVWANKTAIEMIYREAARLTQESGIQHDVDHIYPLQGRTVCGLHVEHNLQILTHVENIRKHNKLPAGIAA